MKSSIFNRSVFVGILILLVSGEGDAAVTTGGLHARVSDNGIVVYRGAATEPVMVQVAESSFRPYLHPLTAPDGVGVLTEFQPNHHRHQTGLYFGFTRVNGRDYFHHPGETHWRRVSLTVLQSPQEDEDAPVSWRTVYDMLGEDGSPVLRETQTWSFAVDGGRYVFDVEWQGEALTDVTIGKYEYGGLFLRMPWRAGMKAEVVNSARHRDQRAEGQRSVWLDIGVQVDGRQDLAHLAIFDHPKNHGFPQTWRVDGQFGVGPVPSREGDWRIPKGQTATLRYQLQAYTGKVDDVELTKAWGKFSGQGGTGAQWHLARKEGRQAEFLTPQKAVENMTLPDTFQVNVYASEPMMTQPMAFCWDDRGRIWIAENRDYETRGTGFSSSGDSRILILEDTDGDGVADDRKVFFEGIPFPAGIAVGFDGLWLGAPPNLLFLPDRDHDDRADTDDIEIHLTGWGIRDRHETLNSFHWGPDGWLYGCQGFATPSRVGKPADGGRIYRHNDPFPADMEFEGDPIDINGGVWRYHPTQQRFEVVAHGFSNPWGLDYDAKGQFFISACVIPHLWHVIPGGIYHRQGGKHFNPYVYRDIRTIADHRHRSAHGGARVYISDAFPPKYHGRIFMANIHEHAVLTDTLEPKGSGFVGRHGDDFLLANNAQWIGFSMEIGPEGGVYVLDWHDADICGTEVLNKQTGRVFRIMPKQSLATHWKGRYDDLAKKPDRHLVELQRSPSAWHARRARLILQYRASNGNLEQRTREQLRQIFVNSVNNDWRLRAMWGLHITGGVGEGELLATLDDADSHMRAWAIQLLCEDFSPSSAAVHRFVRMADEDPSPVVRLYLAAALQRLPADLRWPIANALVTHAEDAVDHNLPMMIWFGVEPLVEVNSQAALKLATVSEIPMITRHIARRLTDAGQLEALVSMIGEAHHVRLSLLSGMRDGLEGRPDAVAPPNWTEVYAKLDAVGGGVGRLAVELAQQFGDVGAAQEMLVTLSDELAPLDIRRQALRGLAARKFSELPPRLIELLDHDDLRRDAIRSMTMFNDRQLGRELLNRYSAFDELDRLEAIHALATRTQYARQMTRAIKEGSVPKRDVPAYVARQLRRIVGASFVDVWGPIDALSDDKQAAFAKYRKLLTVDALRRADPSHGRTVFKRTCMACHRMYGEGGIVGPDITGVNRANLEYLLGNILTPSAIIQDEYKMVMVVTDEGRVISGIVVGENERQLRLRVANQEKPMILAKSQIESRDVAPVSMMPDGLLQTLSDQEVLDLVAYLQTEQQVPQARP